ncbi:hypothetical protein [Actinomadura rugatobispora]|uniref:DUF3291 domain-containing protein n=1 Tax=Actinomadura rugatobispora TaxID=1994 RepID=A0ABW0ZUK9_9ACTN|nr:hypothetical protein GCM10010200_076270 [Actinomadura rugatobispora]
MLRSAWTPGPADAHGHVLVSVTEFTADHLWDMPRIYRAGTRLTRLWPTLEGAVGHWLWLEPLRRRSGSVSLWESDQAMRNFVKLPVHLQIMRAFRDRGSLRSTTWTADDPELSDTWRQASEFLRQ